MKRVWFALGILSLIPKLSSGLEPAPIAYSVDLRVLEGNRLSKETTAKEEPSSVESDLWDTVSKKEGMRVLTTMKLVTVVGKANTLEVKTDKAFSYLVPLGKGKFELKHTKPLVLGMNFTFAVKAVDTDGESVEVSPIKIDLTVLDGREPVEGLDLDVGKPIVATRTLATTAKMKIGGTAIVDVPVSPTKAAALLLRVSKK